ncbi:probable assembly chaperone of rpl4 isoform X2 [Xenopus tropicalis]|uniref:Probable assembly chaperone of rpl4 n=1 Tax=Xenopus tropicalis TaxID=8364 RepID=A0A5S6LIC4_XENTR|nr:probable assembly chaperone of rpl4 isoform X2 [Xenopus tropicalis]|eukprot:XP_017950290.1 PREDICTED: probable assembly chaperone of rpl4 isoform X2 [Xenopus tropicalis]
MGGQAKGKKHGKARKRRPGRAGGNDFSDLPAQDKMKMKMQNRAKKKTAEKYTVHQLLEKTEEYLDNFNYEMAQLFCQRALDMDPTNLDILDMMGNICMELGHAEKAKQVFLKAVELCPDKGHAKYMCLGQIHCKEEALHYFNKGIEIMLSAYQSQPALAKAAGFPDEIEVTTKDIAAAFCSVAEIYFTDLCMEEEAGEKCKEILQKALEYDPNSSEALQLMASYLFSMDQPQEGKEYLMKSLASWLPSMQKKEAEMQGDGTEEPTELASEVLEALLEEDDEVVQVWYLLGWVCYLQAKAPDEDEAFKDSARTYLRKAKKLYHKLKSDDSQLGEHVEQLLSELGGEEALGDSDAEDGALDDVEDDFLESSEDEAMES